MNNVRCGRRRFVRLGQLFVLLISLYILYTILDIIKNSKCSESESVHLMKNLCDDYKNEKVAGNLCHALCTSSKIRYEKCTNYRGGKKVMFVDCEDVCLPGKTVTAVLKSKLREDETLVLPQHHNGSITMEGMTMAESLFNNVAAGMANFQRSPESSIFTELWVHNFEEYVKSASYPAASYTALKSIWSLINQDEYLFIRIYQHLGYIPKLYGTCGPYYMLEYAPTNDILSPSLFSSNSKTWKERANLAILLLELTQSLESDFEEPLHFCDIKEENFGIGSDKMLKILDLDSLFFQKSMLRNLAQPTCSEHEDCDFFDCRGWCNLTTNNCTSQRTNNNVQNVCEDIFINRATNFFKGLLHDPPAAIAEDLQETLDDCAYPNKNKGEIVRKPVSLDTFWKLHNLLNDFT